MVLALGGGVYYLGLQQTAILQKDIDGLNGQITSLQSQLSQTNAKHQSEAAQTKEERQKFQILLKGGQ